ncbi:unnamed protein product [Paramecium primaurelia]|uniref:Uncharacterized protein n=1 Tax=Paramecium primaurelia TaxID=5886 RepID=A0A8S1QQT7_PARPR|nr:unnamed protein product [Paramecium primaurelia]
MVILQRVFLIIVLQWLIIRLVRKINYQLDFYLPVFCQSYSECLNQFLSEQLDEKCLAFIFVNDFSKSLNTIFDTVLPFNQNQQSNCLSWLVLIIFSFIADNFGRKLSSSISGAMTSFEALLVKFDMNQQMLIIVLFFLSFRDMPIINVHYSFINELSYNLIISKILYREQFQ